MLFLFVLVFFLRLFYTSYSYWDLVYPFVSKKKKKAKKDIETGAQALEQRIDGIYPLTHFESQAGSLNL